MTRFALLASAALLAAAPAIAQEVRATASMASPDGADLGTVSFVQAKSGFLHITVEMTGLEAGEHGFHIHETGSCDAADGFKSAGGHYAGGKEHGIDSANGPHAGDMPNVHVSADGVLKLEIFTDRLSLGEGNENPLMDADGSAVVLHAAPDDYQSNPAGNAGDRIACGVIAQPS